MRFCNEMLAVYVDYHASGGDEDELIYFNRKAWRSRLLDLKPQSSVSGFFNKFIIAISMMFTTSNAKQEKL